MSLYFINVKYTFFLNRHGLFTKSEHLVSYKKISIISKMQNSQKPLSTSNKKRKAIKGN